VGSIGHFGESPPKERVEDSEQVLFPQRGKGGLMMMMMMMMMMTVGEHEPHRLERFASISPPLPLFHPSSSFVQPWVLVTIPFRTLLFLTIDPKQVVHTIDGNREV